MAFYKMSMSGRRRVLRWAEAKAWHDNTVPVRGTEVRPAFGRRDQKLRLRETGNGDIVLCLYTTDVVTWHKDDTITLSPGGWSTRLTADAIFRATQIVVVFGPKVSFVRQNDGYYAFSDSVTLMESGVPTEVLPVFLPKLDHTIAAKARKDMKRYRSWLDVVIKMGVKPEWIRFTGTPRGTVATILDNTVNEEEDFPKLYQLTGGDVSKAYALAYELRKAYSLAPVQQPIASLTEIIYRKATTKEETE